MNSELFFVKMTSGHLLEFWLVHDVYEERPEEGGRLAAASLGNADDVPPAQRRRNGHRLNRRWLGKFALPKVNLFLLLLFTIEN